MSNDLAFNKTLKSVLWLSMVALVWTSIMDFGTMAIGINTYGMYLIAGIIMLYVLIKMKSNRHIIWGIPLICGMYFIVELFNLLYYSFRPATAFFHVYFSIFGIGLIAALIFIKRNSISFDFKKSRILLISGLMTIAITVGYIIQWKT